MRNDTARFLRRHLAAATIVMAIVLIPLRAYAEPVRVQPGTIQHQNIQTAITFLRDHGDTQAADEIQKLLDEGQIYVDSELAENAETSALNNLTLNPSVAGHTMPFNRDEPLDPEADFQQVLELARTLYHENIHANHQSYMSWWISGITPGNSKERHAWSQTLGAMERWLNVERAQFDVFYRPTTPGMSPADELRELRKIETKMRVLARYFGDYRGNKYFGGNDEGWVSSNLNYLQHEQETYVGPRIQKLDQSTNQPTAQTPSAGPPAAAAAPTPAPAAAKAAPDPAPVSGPIPCLPCQPIADQIRDARAELRTLLGEQAAAHDALAEVQQQIGDLEKQIQGLDRQLESGAGTGGRSYDPSTGITVDAWDQGNGTVKITTTDANGHILEERTRDSSQHKAEARHRLDQARDALTSRKAEAQRLTERAAAADAAVDTATGRLTALAAELADCIEKNCKGMSTAEALNHLGLPSRTLEQGTSFDDCRGCNQIGGNNAGDRDQSIQYMMIEIINIRVGQQLGAEIPSLARAARTLWDILRGVTTGTTYLSAGNGLRRSRSGAPPQQTNRRAVNSDAGLQTLLTSLGTSMGEAFQIQVAHDGTTPLNLQGSGVIVEALKPAVARQARRQINQLARRNPVTQKLDAYCVEFLRQPPSLGTIFRVANPEIQKKFAPMRSLLHAAHRLQQAGVLRPDSDPRAYFSAIKQWALWTKERNFNEKSYGEAFIEHTRKGAIERGARWTNQLESSLRALVPGRWADITKIVNTAEGGLRASGQ